MVSTSELTPAGSLPMIELEHVYKYFGGGAAPAVRGVSLRIEAGEFIAIVGASGSGKSTTLKTINRLLEADAGSIRIEGESIKLMPGHLLRRRIGYVFQDVGLFPHMSVVDNIGVTPRLLGWPRPAIEARANELLDLIRLPRSYATRAPATLSGGQKQRVGIARALAAQSKIMLMDEPFGALDPLTRDALGGEYRQLHERMRLTTVMITHDVSEALVLADRILVMDAGAIIAEGTPRELLTKQTDADVQNLMAMPRRQAQRVQKLLE